MTEKGFCILVKRLCWRHEPPGWEPLEFSHETFCTNHLWFSALRGRGWVGTIAMGIADAEEKGLIQIFPCNRALLSRRRSGRFLPAPFLRVSLPAPRPPLLSVFPLPSHRLQGMGSLSPGESTSICPTQGGIWYTGGSTWGYFLSPTYTCRKKSHIVLQRYFSFWAILKYYILLVAFTVRKCR